MPKEGEANGFEWRTFPLWSVGLAQTVNPYTSFGYKEDACIRMEAVLLHSREAQVYLDKVLKKNKLEHSELIRFLESM